MLHAKTGTRKFALLFSSFCLFSLFLSPSPVDSRTHSFSLTLSLSLTFSHCPCPLSAGLYEYVKLPRPIPSTWARPIEPYIERRYPVMGSRCVYVFVCVCVHARECCLQYLLTLILTCAVFLLSHSEISRLYFPVVAPLTLLS